MQLIGKTLGQYRILEEIGHGGMAIVYKAYQPSLDRIVAIKVLAPQHAQAPGYRDRFFQEAKAVARLSHPNILEVHDVGMDEDWSYIVMKFVSGPTMRKFIGEPMPLARASNIIEQIAAGLDHAHSHGVIHRDIKSSNILMEGDWVFITDFGIAKIMEASIALTGTGELMGTPAYMSPEQGSGKPVDHRTDIYSLGIVLYELITGRVPFTGETPYGVIFKHVNDPLPMPRCYIPDLPENVERVVLKALAKDPDHRYESAGQMAAALREAVAAASRDAAPGRPLAAEPAGVVGAQHLQPQREISSFQAVEGFATCPKPAEPQQKKKPLSSFRRVALILACGALLLSGISLAYFSMRGGGGKERTASEQTPPAEVRTQDGAPSEPKPQESPQQTTLQPGDLQVQYEQATRFLQDKNYAEALDRFGRLAAQGHIASQNELGRMHMQGLGVNKDFHEAAEWFGKAADRGDAGGRVGLGILYLRGGPGVQKDEKAALNWFKLAAEQGDPDGEFHFGNMYRYGRAVKQDFRAAAKWLKKAAEQGHAESESELGYMYMHGLGVEKNFKEAVKRFTKAADQGHMESQNELGYMYVQGLGVKKDFKEAAGWFQKAADKGYAGSQINLGMLYLKGGYGIQQDDQAALSWFKLAAEQGDPDGQFYLGNMFRHGRGGKQNLEEAAKWYKKATDQGHEGAKMALKSLKK